MARIVTAAAEGDMNGRALLAGFLMSAAFSVQVFAQATVPSASTNAPSPEMARLAKVFAGDWKTTESMERSRFFPAGGGRQGTSHWRLDVGGTTLVGEGSSDGSVGPLDYLITIWWDKTAKVYYFFTCFKDSAGSSCRVRGTAHWEGNSFVNEYEEAASGTKWRVPSSRLRQPPTP